MSLLDRIHEPCISIPCGKKLISFWSLTLWTDRSLLWSPGPDSLALVSLLKCLPRSDFMVLFFQHMLLINSKLLRFSFRPYFVFSDTPLRLHSLFVNTWIHTDSSVFHICVPQTTASTRWALKQKWRAGWVWACYSYIHPCISHKLPIECLRGNAYQYKIISVLKKLNLGEDKHKTFSTMSLAIH